MSYDRYLSSPVLMIGHGSSGTSILATLLREQLGIAFGTESQFIVHYYWRLALYGDLHDDRNLQRLVSHILSERFFQRSAKFGFHTDTDAIMARVHERSYRGVLEAIFSEFARQLGMARWGDKTPAYNHDLDVLNALFPTAQFIHMIRDGRDVALSVSRRYWGHKNVSMAALEWRNEINLIDRFIATLPAERIIEIRYEDLLTDPVETLRQLTAFLGIPDPDGIRLSEIERTVPLQLKRTNFDKWRREWSATTRLAFETIACRQLQRHGYDTIVESPGPNPNAATRALWYCDNKIKKWAYADYWRDNFYKARWRSRNVLRAVSSCCSIGNH